MCLYGNSMVTFVFGPKSLCNTSIARTGVAIYLMVVWTNVFEFQFKSLAQELYNISKLKEPSGWALALQFAYKHTQSALKSDLVHAANIVWKWVLSVIVFWLYMRSFHIGLDCNKIRNNCNCHWALYATCHIWCGILIVKVYTQFNVGNIPYIVWLNKMIKYRTFIF